MRVAVTGAEGQLGAEIVAGWADDEVLGWSRAEVDITDPSAVAQAVTAAAPDVVVNCAAWTDVDGCERDPGRADLVNAVGAGAVASAAAGVGARVVQVSTDFVHGGDVPRDRHGHPRGWREDDDVAPVNAYGRSKARGEQLVREATDDHVIVRTAWVCGVHGDNFVRTMLRLGRRGQSLRVVDDQHGSPTFTADLSVALREVAASSVTGTVNRANAGGCSWFDLAAATFAEAGLEVDLTRQPSSALERDAARPAWSVLDQSRADALGLSTLPPWRDGLARLVAAYDGIDLD